MSTHHIDTEDEHKTMATVPSGAGSGGGGAGGRPTGLDRRHHGRQQRPGLRSGCAGGGGKRAPPARMNWNALRAIRRTRLDANECKWINPFRLPADPPSEPSARHGATCATLRTAQGEREREHVQKVVDFPNLVAHLVADQGHTPLWRTTPCCRPGSHTLVARRHILKHTPVTYSHG